MPWPGFFGSLLIRTNSFFSIIKAQHHAAATAFAVFYVELAQAYSVIIIIPKSRACDQHAHKTQRTILLHSSLLPNCHDHNSEPEIGHDLLREIDKWRETVNILIQRAFTYVRACIVHPAIFLYVTMDVLFSRLPLTLPVSYCDHVCLTTSAIRQQWTMKKNSPLCFMCMLITRFRYDNYYRVTEFHIEHSKSSCCSMMLRLDYWKKRIGTNQ